LKRVVALLALCAACGGAPSIHSFSADRDRILKGDPVTLSWNVDGANHIEIEPQPGTVTGSSATVLPQATTSYVLHATNTHGSTASQPVQVSVVQNAIASFAAFPDEVEAGGTVELRWKLAIPATSSSVNGTAVAPGETTLRTNPQDDTTYLLTVQTALGSSTSSVRVRVGAPPKVTIFAPDALTVQRGTSTVLRWTASFASTFTVTDSTTTFAVGSLHSLRVRPLRDTTYTLTATNVFGNSTANTAVTVSGDFSAALSYTDPPVGNEGLRLVADPASTATQAILKLVATSSLASLSAIALDLPFDGTVAGSRDGSARVSLHAVSPNGPPDLAVGRLDPVTGSPTPALALALPGAGPLAGTLALGIAQKPTSIGGPPDAALAPGDAIATFKLDLVPEGGVGVVFDGSSGLLTSGNGFRVRLRAGGHDVAVAVAIGKLETRL